MTLRLLACALPGLVLAACASQPTGQLAAGADGVRVGTDEPGPGYERLRTYTGYSGKGCDTGPARDHREQARIALINTVHRTGADYIRLVGHGPAEERGRCVQDVYRLSGVAYRREAAGPGATDSSDGSDGSESAEAATRPDPAPTAGSTEEKLLRLERLRERELVTEDEYRRLRERILDEAFSDG